MPANGASQLSTVGFRHSRDDRADSGPGQSARVLFGFALLLWHVYALAIYPWANISADADLWLFDLLTRGLVVFASLACGVLAFLLVRNISWKLRLLTAGLFFICQINYLFISYVSLVIIGGIHVNWENFNFLVSTFSGTGMRLFALSWAIYTALAAAGMLLAWNLARRRGRRQNWAAIGFAVMMPLVGMSLVLPSIAGRQYPSDSLGPALEAAFFQLLWIVMWAVSVCILDLVGNGRDRRLELPHPDSAAEFHPEVERSANYAPEPESLQAHNASGRLEHSSETFVPRGPSRRTRSHRRKSSD